MDILERFMEILPLLIPVILIDLGMKVYAFIDIMKEDRRVKGNSKVIWILVSVLINFGWVIYFAFGKDE